MTKPHFDDEQTVLAARPVVPLEEVDVKLKHRRRWFLGGAFVVAMLLGAATAIVSAYFRIRNVPDPEIQPSSVSQESLTPALPQIEEQPVVKVVKTQAVKRNTNHTDSRAAVLVDQWQERRPRRVETPERRRAQHHDRDLSNINEIFEGRPRP